ncbi:TIR domain-containing protein [Methylobacter tundripaludum]|uniref:TIR domain-containing protein n=1 Tax=Methylobacter tundripaludum TaxID=173365 RepID=A0A2S6H8X3_9GAMM|nr:toll/interleukin-1 receptor domain-containing protein [Methylobacter tundripaludum]PPK73918.1 TIR domain-containing protein [Methylobacter tundripaludum]
MDGINNPVGTKKEAAAAINNSTEKATTLPVSVRGDQFWNRLLKSIAEGIVIPVIGVRLFTWGEPDNPKTLQREVAMKLLEIHQVDPSSVILSPNRELHQAVSYLKEKLPDKEFQNLYGDVSDAFDEVVSRPDFHVPHAITRLAAISDFRLLVTTAPYPIFADALRERCALNEIIHSPYAPSVKATDLSSEWESRPGESNLLYLFGKIGSTMVYAIHDEDILEYAHNLLCHGKKVPDRFIAELQQKNLLLIGCNFPDWLSRFFIRLTNTERLSDKKTNAWVVEEMEGQTDLIVFLQSYSNKTEILSNLSPQSFVEELHSRWTERHGGASDPGKGIMPKGPDPNGVIFFISYSRATDLPAAEKLYQTLLNLGVTEREIWFDQDCIEPGVEFQKLIFKGIRVCRYFLPLISSAADQFKEKFFYSEWRAAIERSKFQGFGENVLVMPVIVDEDYKPDSYRNVPREWIERIDFAHAPDGVPDARLRKALIERIREFRSPKKPTAKPTGEAG